MLCVWCILMVIPVMYKIFLDSEDVHIDFPKHVYIGKLTVVDLTKAVTPYVYVYTSADVYSGVV